MGTQVVLSDHTWCQGHATCNAEGDWQCKTTGAIIQATGVRRSLHDGPFPSSGSGSVSEVLHLHCPECNPNWQPPAYGTPITLGEIAELQ